MSSSNLITKSTLNPNQGSLTDNLKRSQQYAGNSIFHPVRLFDNNDASNKTSSLSRTMEDILTEKLSGMKIQRPSHSLHKPIRQRKATVSPYYRKTPITPPRTPEVSRKSFRMYKNPTMKFDKTEKINGNATRNSTLLSIFSINE
ncbi:hypothetical protein DFH28DRAFT_1051235 [Melampsora americana]|nr:hypothetical protein DFH28DRAFT_1051235 [Melampsora americana]